ncbi:MAG: alkaline phosphatase family protein [Planctomycetes bacterium]|nr:alkaline phosphatase family protein [Planctomycetota bacterium]
MRGRLLLAGILALFAAAAAAGSVRAGAAAREKPRVILLGFDGADFELTRRWMESGDLPNLKRLAERGTFGPLATANPAQSPVSWGVLETASNPGKTNLGDFVRRKFEGDQPIPVVAGVTREDGVPADEVGTRLPLTRFEKFLLPLGVAKRRVLPLSLLAGGLLLAAALLARLVLRLRAWACLLIGLATAGGGAFCVNRFLLAGLPETYRVPVTEFMGRRFFDVLGEHGIRVIGLETPLAFPAQAHENARILGGLFTPDVSGGTGAWYVYTNDEWTLAGPTRSGGVVIKLGPDEDGVIRTEIRGPRDFAARQSLKERSKALSKRAADLGLSGAERDEARAALLELKRAQREEGGQKTVPFEIRPDFRARRARIAMDGEEQEVVEGAWSEFFRMRFSLAPLLPVHAIGRVLVEQCSLDESGNERLRLFVPPISVSPEDPPPWLPISSPRGFASDLAAAIGLYDTVGWACYTNALKDSETSVQAFLSGIEHVLAFRTKMLMHEIEQDDWDVLFHVEYATDRVQHMLYASIDPEHPRFGAAGPDGRPERDAEVRAFGRSFRVRDGIKETYCSMDRVIGGVLERIESGALGGNVHLLVVSDHGFQPYRFGVNLNVWLNRMGYLALLGEGEEGGATRGREKPRGFEALEQYVDWSRTRAYSMGLGKIYINLAGREPLGIVPAAEFAALKKEIIAKLEAFVDPIEGHGRRPVFARAYDAAEIYSGPYHEVASDPACLAGFGDIVVGVSAGYRPSWGATMGGFERDTYEHFGVGTNDLPWSGDHCGVEPALVPGILAASFALPELTTGPRLAGPRRRPRRCSSSGTPPS